MTKLPVMPVSWYDKEWNKQTRRLSAGKVFGINKNGRVNINDSIIWHKIKNMILSIQFILLIGKGGYYA